MTEQIANINIEDFVSEVLQQLINGVKKAQQHAKDNGAHINSDRIKRVATTNDLRMSNQMLDVIVQEVEFDVAVSVSNQGNLKGGMGLVVPVLGIGYQAEKETTNATVSRIKFKIPVAFPTQS